MLDGFSLSSAALLAALDRVNIARGDERRTALADARRAAEALNADADRASARLAAARGVTLADFMASDEDARRSLEERQMLYAVLDAIEADDARISGNESASSATSAPE